MLRQWIEPEADALLIPRMLRNGCVQCSKRSCNGEHRIVERNNCLPKSFYRCIVKKHIVSYKKSLGNSDQLPMLQPTPSDYLESWADELHSRASRVRQLIGSNHWAQDGYHKESILHAFLRKYLPAEVLISRGFVTIGKQATPISPEVDVLITKPSQSLLWFSEEGLQIAPPSAVCAHIHVKTTLNASNLDDTIETSNRTNRVCEEGIGGEPAWSASFFYQTAEKDVEKRAKTIFKSLKKSKENGKLLPSAICCLDGPFAQVRKKQSSSETRYLLSVFDSKKLAPAVLLVELFGALRYGAVQTQRLEVEDYIANAGTSCVLSEEI